MICNFLFNNIRVRAQQTSYDGIDTTHTNLSYIRDSLGRHQGIWKSFYSDGKGHSKGILGIMQFRNDTLVGRSLEFYSNGKIKNDFCCYGEPDGERKYYNSNGNFIYIEKFKMDKLDGLTSYFDEKGKLSATVEYSNGVRGIEKHYRQNGRLDYSTYHAGELDKYEEHGTRKIYSDDEANQLIEEQDFFYGNKTKARYYENGKLVREERF